MNLPVAIMTACAAITGNATARTMSVYDDHRCRDAAVRFAALHGLRSTPIVPPCVIAPCTVQGVQIHYHGRYGVASLKRYFTANPATRTCIVEDAVDPTRSARNE